MCLINLIQGLAENIYVYFVWLGTIFIKIILLEQTYGIFQFESIKTTCYILNFFYKKKLLSTLLCQVLIFQYLLLFYCLSFIFRNYQLRVKYIINPYIIYGYNPHFTESTDFWLSTSFGMERQGNQLSTPAHRNS